MNHNNKQAVGVYCPIIWGSSKKSDYLDIIAFQDSSSVGDSIRATTRIDWFPKKFGTNGVDRKPDISCGIEDAGGQNVWVIWESNENGRWHLVGTKIKITWWGVEDENTPEVFKLYQNYPNPFNPTTTISYYLTKPTSVRLEIYNTLGVKVKTYFEENLQVGEHKIVWDGKDDKGRSSPSGVYYYRFTTDKSAQIKKMLLLK
jgi:hypothetical protein